MKNFSYTIKEGEHKGETLWSGRYCAVLAMTVVRQVIKKNTFYWCQNEVKEHLIIKVVGIFNVASWSVMRQALCVQQERLLKNVALQ